MNSISPTPPSPASSEAFRSPEVQSAVAAVKREFAAYIEWRLISSLKLKKKNPRIHPPEQIARLAASIKAMTFVIPCIIDEHDNVLDGHARIAAAELLGQKDVPVIQLDHLTDAQKRALVIFINRIPEQSKWDHDLLIGELTALLEIDAEFDIELTGFTTTEVDLLFERQASPERDQADDLPAEPEKILKVSQLGDLWILGGRHRLFCGNALEPESYAILMEGQKAQMVFSDPPYNVKISGHVGGAGRIKHREFVMASGEMTEAEFTAFLRTAFELLVRYSCDGAIHYICMDWRHLPETLQAAKGVYTEQKNLCIWAKTNAGMGGFYRSQHELILVFKSGQAQHINNFGLGAGGRYRTNVWSYAGVNIPDPARRRELALHPTVKPVGLVADAIRDCSKRHGIILDPFGGSGTTLLAAQRTGRRGYMMELEPHYVDVALHRFRTSHPEIDIYHAKSGFTPDEIAQTRHGGQSPDQAEPHVMEAIDD